MRNDVMKKNNFLEGAFIATIGIILCKIIGVLYVIPFYAIIGEKGATLYGYAYSIYAVFLTLSSNGIPIAISKIVSEYNSLEKYYTKEKAYKIGKAIIVLLGFLSFLVLFIFAPQMAYLIIGDIKGGVTINEISFVIRIVSTALLIVPLFSVTKGYLQGHKFITSTSIANVLEQLVRVIVLLTGSYLTLKVFHLSIDTAVGIAVFGATVGATVAYFYLYDKVRKNKEQLKINEPITREETKITAKDITKKILFYAVPFIVIDLVRSAFSMVDVFTVVKTLNKLNYPVSEAETVIRIITTWGGKLNMIVISLALGLTISLIPNIAASYVKKDIKDVSKKINQSVQALFVLIVPMAIGLFLLATPVWTIFYGSNTLSANIYQFYVLQTITFSFYSIFIDITQTMNNTKLALGTLIGSFLTKALLNIPMMKLFNNIGLSSLYAPIATTLIVQTLAVIFISHMLKKKHNINYKGTFENIVKTILCSFIMLITLLILKTFYPIVQATRMMSVLQVLVYALIGGTVYLIVTYKSGLLENIFGKEILNKIINKLKKNAK